MWPLTRETLIFAGIIIAISFVLSIIVTLISRQSNKNERMLKNITRQISNFRSETAATTERISETSRNCQEAVEMKVGQAEDMVRQIADSLEALAQHQEDLSSLETVCVNYKNALEKLRASTEQAEGRIQVVQQEARKVETVNDFIRGFRVEADSIKNQLDESKGEYVRLVASTEESLKSAAEAQKKSNQEMLAEFEGKLARYRTEFGDYVDSEKTKYADFLEDERQKSEEMAANAESRRDEIKKALDDATQRLDGYKIVLEATLSSIEERNGTLRSNAETALTSFASATYRRTDEAKQAIDQIIEDAKRKIDDLMAAENDKAVAREKSMSASLSEIKAQLDGIMKSKSDEFATLSDSIAEAFTSAMSNRRDAMERSLLELADKLEAEKASIKDTVEELKRTGNEAEANTKGVLEEALLNAENARASLDADKNVFIASSRDAIARDFNAMLSELDERYSKMKDDGEIFLQNLDNRMQDTRVTIAQLSEGEGEKIANAIDRLKELDDKIKSSEEQLSHLFEEITKSREELFTVQQERIRLDNDISERAGELERIQSDMQSSKTQKINEEAALTRLRLQISSLRNESEKQESEDVGALAEEAGIAPAGSEDEAFAESNVEESALIENGESEDAATEAAEIEAVSEIEDAQEGFEETNPSEPEEIKVSEMEVDDKTPEDMIEEFPEDIFTGSFEDVDLSEDEDEDDKDDVEE